jgi:MFS family permease
MPIGMYGLAILLLVRDAHGSFAVAGRVVGAFGVANALGAVAQGRLMDRFGQPAVLRRVAPVHAALLVALVLAADRDAPSWVLAVCAFGAGAFLPQVPAAMRSLWTALVDDQDLRQTAYALVTIVFEVSVVTAPVVTAAIAAVASPAAAVLTAAAVGASGALVFAATAASRRWHGTPHEVGPLGPLHARGVRTLFLVLLAFGTAVGVLQVALPAFAAGRGSAEAGGFYLAAISAGSLVGGLVYGSRRWPGRPPLRLAVLLLALGTGCLLVAAATGAPRRPRGGARRRSHPGPHDRRLLVAARHRGAGGDGDRGVRRDRHGDRRRHGHRQRDRRRDRRRRHLPFRRPRRGRDRRARRRVRLDAAADPAAFALGGATPRRGDRSRTAR